MFSNVGTDTSLAPGIPLSSKNSSSNAGLDTSLAPGIPWASKNLLECADGYRSRSVDSSERLNSTKLIACDTGINEVTRRNVGLYSVLAFEFFWRRGEAQKFLKKFTACILYL